MQLAVSKSKAEAEHSKLWIKTSLTDLMMQCGCPNYSSASPKSQQQYICHINFFFFNLGEKQYPINQFFFF